MWLNDGINVVKKRMTHDGGGMGLLAERLQRKWDCQHFAMEVLHFSTIPYPVHSWMLVVVQRPWPLVGKVLVWLSRNRSAQFWDSTWKITELIWTKHTAQWWERSQNGSLQYDNFNRHKYFGSVTDYLNFLQCKIMKQQSNKSKSSITTLLQSFIEILVNVHQFLKISIQQYWQSIKGWMLTKWETKHGLCEVKMDD